RPRRRGRDRGRSVAGRPWHRARPGAGVCRGPRPADLGCRERRGRLGPRGTAVDALYEAGSESALDVIRETEDGIRRLVVVGHNPTMASLATLLDDGEGDDEAGNEVATGFPTCAVAVLQYDGEWAELDEASASVVAYHVGRG